MVLQLVLNPTTQLIYVYNYIPLCVLNITIIVLLVSNPTTTIQLVLHSKAIVLQLVVYHATMVLHLHKYYYILLTLHC